MARPKGTTMALARLLAACVACGGAGCAPGDDDSTWLPDVADAFGDDAADVPVDADVADGADPGHEADAPPDARPDGADEATPGDSGPEDAPADEATSTVEPPLGGSSGGSGGSAPVGGDTRTAGGTTYRLIVPSGYPASRPAPFLVVFSGTEGGSTMTSNLLSVGPYVGIDGFVIAVLDGTTYYGDGAAGVPVIDDVRARYDIDNDRTYLLGESAGTSAGLELGFDLRQSYFAAFWANDVNASAAPARSATELGFAPWGNAGPGGDYADAEAIVGAMRTAGYRLPPDAPYSGPGSGSHGSTEQFIEACRFFAGKSRR